MAWETWWQEGELAGHIVPVRKQTTDRGREGWRHKISKPDTGDHLFRQTPLHKGPITVPAAGSKYPST